MFVCLFVCLFYLRQKLFLLLFKNTSVDEQSRILHNYKCLMSLLEERLGHEQDLLLEKAFSTSTSL